MFFSVRTSEIEFALLERVEVGEGRLDELAGKTHGCVGVVVLVGLLDACEVEMC